MSDMHRPMLQAGSNLCVCGMPASDPIHHGVQSMPPGQVAPRIANVPVAEPTITETVDDLTKVRTVTVNWPDTDPDVCLITRGVLLDLARQLNDGRYWEHAARVVYARADRWSDFGTVVWDELCEWHHEGCEGADDPRPRAEGEPTANCSCHNIALKAWRDLTDADEWGDEDEVGE